MGCSGSREQVVEGGVAKHGVGELVKRKSEGSAGLHYNMLRATRASNGSRFHRIYELQEDELGSAAEGCVVRAARNKDTGEMFACKTFNVSGVRDRTRQRDLLAILRNEIDMLRRLDHPNIIRAYEAYEVGKDLHLIMELCTGGDLNARRYTEEEAAIIVRQILSAIHYSHQQGICHRDLKFENILWESKASDAQIKLIDFGMSAKFVAGTTMNERVGTVYTMAPEVLEESYTEKADLWSVGCIAFHLIAGVSPFECQEEVETMKRLLAAKFFWPPGLDVSSDAKMFVFNLLKKDPRRRWSAEEALASDWISRYAPGSRGPTPAPSSNDLSLEDDSPIRSKLVSSMRDYVSYGTLRRIALMVVAYHESPETLAVLRREFLEFDRENNGQISRGEMHGALAPIGVSRDEVEKLFVNLDVDQSGDIHYLEFLAATIEAVGVMEEERLRFAFDRLDTDESGYITKSNLREVMGHGYDEEAIEVALEEADTNKDGKVDWHQFLEHMKRSPRAIDRLGDEKMVGDTKQDDREAEDGAAGDSVTLISWVKYTNDNSDSAGADESMETEGSAGCSSEPALSLEEAETGAATSMQPGVPMVTTANTASQE